MRGLKADLNGQRFGKLVVEQTSSSVRGTRWLVKCDCGSDIKTVSAANLLRVTRGVRSCGCATRRAPGVAAKNMVMKWYKANAKRRDLAWELTDDHFMDFTSLDCHYCGIPPSSVAKPKDSSNGDFIYNGLDRVDNDLGYVVSNIKPCCPTCNHAKGTMLYSEFMDFIRRIVKTHKNLTSEY
jgi:hypothetical protein